MDHYTWIFALSVPVAFIAAFGIGANDLANSFATSVGAKAITVSPTCSTMATAFQTFSVNTGSSSQCADCFTRGLLTAESCRRAT